jgi:arginase
VQYDGHQSFLDIPYNPSSSSSASGSDSVQRLPDPNIGKMKKPRLVSAVNEMVADAVGTRAEKGWLPLTLGGDHSLVSLT